MKKFCNIRMFFAFFPIMALASPTDISQAATVTFTRSKDANEIKIRGEKQASEHVARSLIASYCEENDNLIFKIGDQKFSAKREIIDQENSTVKTLKFNKHKDTGEFEWSIPANLGCKENPANYALIEVKNPTSPSIILTETQDNSSVWRYIDHLNKSKMCQTTKYSNVIACTGSKHEQSEKVFIVFMLPITPTGGAYMGASKIPVHARCEAKSPPEFTCVVNEYFEKGFKSTLQISHDALSKDAIIKAREFIINETQKLMID